MRGIQPKCLRVSWRVCIRIRTQTFPNIVSRCFWSHVRPWLLPPWHPNLIKAGDFMCDSSSWHSDDTLLRTSSRRPHTMFLSALKNRSAWIQHTMCDIHRSVHGTQIILNCTKPLRKTKQSMESDKTRRRNAGGVGGKKQFREKIFLQRSEEAVDQDREVTAYCFPVLLPSLPLFPLCPLSFPQGVHSL